VLVVCEVTSPILYFFFVIFSHSIGVYLLQFGIAVKVLRNGEEDAWNQIFSSAAAGAFFARKGKFLSDLIYYNREWLNEYLIAILVLMGVIVLFSLCLLDGPQAMLRGALFYGGLIYATSGSFGLGKKQLEEFTEKPAVRF